VFGPCARYEIDSTVADVWLVARFDRRQLIGRPIVYVVVDTWSRMIVGFHVALHGPSWETATLAIISAFTPKLPVLKALGFDDVDESTWPAEELCLELTSDRGEVFNNAVKKTLQSQLGVTSRVVGGSRGDAKAVVERKFGTLNTKLSWIPGAYMARMKEADLEKRQNPFDARLDIDQFTAIIADEILQCNNNTDYPELLLPEMRLTHMGEPTPRTMYLWGLEHRTGDKVPNLSTRELYILFLPRKMCSVARDGITFRANQRYIPDMMLPEQIRRRPGATGSAGRVEVAYNPNNPHAVLARDSDTGDWVDAVINPQDAKAIPGLTDDEIEDMIAGDALGVLDRRDKRATSRHRTTRRQQGIIDRSIAAHNAAPPAASKAQIKRDTKSARAKEAESQRQQAHTNLSQSQPTVLPLPKASKPTGAVLPANKGSTRAKVLSFISKRTRSRDGKDK